MENNQIVLIAFGVIAFFALGYLIYRQTRQEDDADQSEVQSEDDAYTSDSYDEDSEVYSD